MCEPDSRVANQARAWAEERRREGASSPVDKGLAWDLVLHGIAVEIATRVESFDSADRAVIRQRVHRLLRCKEEPARDD